MGLLGLGVGVFLVWAHKGTKEPLEHDNRMPETYFREQD